MEYRDVKDFEKEMQFVADALSEAKRQRALRRKRSGEVCGELRINIELPYSSAPNRGIKPWRN